MPPIPSRRIVVVLVMLALCIGIVQLDRTAATPRIAQNRSLATRVPGAGAIRPLVNSAVAPVLSPPLRDISPSCLQTMPTLPSHCPGPVGTGRRGSLVAPRLIRSCSGRPAAPTCLGRSGISTASIM